ncbi:MAG: NADP-dependent phosphogluconate dehydrogenase [Armatimonadota bacterium]
MDSSKGDIGIVGLGVMGRNFTLNIADHGFSVVGYDKNSGRMQELNTEAGDRNVRTVENLEHLADLLKTPRIVMTLVPAGPIVDSVIKDLLPYLQSGDIIIDGGNSLFTDTDVRIKALAVKGIHFLGVGISGGEAGARFGPSIMPGGSKEAYEQVRAIFEASAARVDGEPCVRYMGSGSAGHYVKMVHNGIEYALMQLIAETYDIMKRGLGLTDDQLHEVYTAWNQTELNSYLLEITAKIFLEADDISGQRLIDVVLDEAGQKGTGKWASQNAMDLQVPVPTIHEAVTARDLSGCKVEREEASVRFGGWMKEYKGNKDTFLTQLQNALYASMIITYAQGFELLTKGSSAYVYGINPEDTATIWRGGCIIRAALLEKIKSIFREQPNISNLLASDFGRELTVLQWDIREVVKTAVDLEIPIPAMMASIAYFDGYRSAWLPANLIQAQRDYFGAHTYERVDTEGVFHTNWGID